MKIRINWKQHLKTIVVFLLIVAVCGAIVVVSGIAPIAASSGHWEITKWFLNFSKKRAVATHSMMIEVPELDIQAKIVQGAGHYEIGCRQCHGSPGKSPPRIVSLMTPKPPDIASVVSKREPQELFYIVKHGIMLTGMPAWPSQERDDEVWSVVAFLLKYPQLSEADYEQLAFGDFEKQSAQSIGATAEESLTVPHEVIETCAGCHGVDGQGRGLGVFPKLAGQNEAYMIGTLIAYQEDRRHSGTMEPVAGRVDEEIIKEVAQYYSQLKPGNSKISSMVTQEKREAIARGQEVATNGIPDQNVPSCADCHPTTRNPYRNAYPTLIGQYADYLELQLNLFNQRKRGGTKSANLMHAVVDHLKPSQMRDVSLYYASLIEEE